MYSIRKAFGKSQYVQACSLKVEKKEHAILDGRGFRSEQPQMQLAVRAAELQRRTNEISMG